MQAIVYEKYGSPAVLQLKEMEKPAPKNDEVLIKIHAASVNNWDWDRLTGKPYLYRLFSGISKPRLKTLGADIAGIVEETGRDVTEFEPGDEVFGDLCEDYWGGFAEYVCARAGALAKKPPFMSFEQAASIPQAGTMAYQGIYESKEIIRDSKVLMNGAGGGVGTFAIQMAKTLGAHVTGVDHTSKLDFLRSIGADEVIDYTQEDFTKSGLKYDLILDVVANRSVFSYKHVLNPGGVYAMIGGKISSALQVLLLGPLISGQKGKKIGILAHKPNEGLEYISELFETGKVKPVIDKCYPLKNTPKALQYLGEGRTRGKVIITMQENHKI